MVMIILFLRCVCQMFLSRCLLPDAASLKCFLPDASSPDASSQMHPPKCILPAAFPQFPLHLVSPPRCLQADAFLDAFS